MREPQNFIILGLSLFWALFKQSLFLRNALSWFWQALASAFYENNLRNLSSSPLLFHVRVSLPFSADPLALQTTPAVRLARSAS